MGEQVARTAIGDGPADPLPRIYGCTLCAKLPVTYDESAAWDHCLTMHGVVAVPREDMDEDAIFALAVPKDEDE